MATAKKKGTSKATKKAQAKGETVRLRVFKLLAKSPDGLTGSEIMKRLKLGGIPSLLKDEGVNGNPPRIRRLDIEGVRGVTYQLTPAGKKALTEGTVDSAAPDSAAGREWPNGR